MLYTIVPLEKVYISKTPACNKPEEKEIEIKDISIQNGIVSVRRDKDQYVVEKIWSTDMKDYLNDDYTPGTIMKL